MMYRSTATAAVWPAEDSDPATSTFAQNMGALLESRPLESRGGENLDSLLPAGNHAFSRDRRYRVRLPANYNPKRESPLVVVLHGCHQTHDDIQKISGFDAIADREHCVVVYPYVSNYMDIRSLNCWGWWIRSHRQRGQGEVEDIWRIVETVSANYRVNQSRVHVCGLSSGAGMAVAALVAHSDRFTSGACVAGVAYGESARSVRLARHVPVRHRSLDSLLATIRGQLSTPVPPPLLIIQSTSDERVELQCALNLHETWLQVSNLAKAADHSAHGTTRLLPWRIRTHLDDRKRQQLMLFTVDGVPHGWFGGMPGKYSTPDAPCITELIWWFFSEQHKTDNPPDGPDWRLSSRHR